MIAKIVPGAYSIVAAAWVEGTFCLVLDCENYQEYHDLPAALSYEGRVCAKTGWNSDKNVAYYQSNRTVAYLTN